MFGRNNLMTPTEATNQQIELYRDMTGEERLVVGLRLHELSCDMAREGIRAQFPDLTPEGVEEKLRERIRIGYRLARGKG
jgi:hypothetical protein